MGFIPCSCVGGSHTLIVSCPLKKCTMPFTWLPITTKESSVFLLQGRKNPVGNYFSTESVQSIFSFDTNPKTNQTNPKNENPRNQRFARQY
jgi:hypothetical protein